MLTVRALSGDDVIEAGLRFDEEVKARPASRFRAFLRRLLRRD
ncbi:MAG: hypothetical protein WDM81_05340 [Rhizomicrobium sp.]